MLENNSSIAKVTEDFSDFTDQKEIRKANDDIMRFKKNKFSSGFALLSIIFNVFYFISIYKSDEGNFYYKMIIGASVLYNLIFMLAAFLCAEGVKNYKMPYAITLIVIGVLQIIRIFILPMQAKTTMINKVSGEVAIMQTTQFTWVVIFLLTSAAFAIIGGVVGILKSKKLKSHLAEIGKSE